MEILGLDGATLVMGLLIFLSRVVDVSLGTIRTINIVRGNTRTAFILGFLEVSIWISVVSTVVQQVASKPWLGFFYACGFSTGNVVGIVLERRLSAGYTLLRVITSANNDLLGMVRRAGFRVNLFEGVGASGTVWELNIVCRKKDLGGLMRTVREAAPDALYISEQAGSVNKVVRPIGIPATGWRSIFKKK